MTKKAHEKMFKFGNQEIQIKTRLCFLPIKLENVLFQIHNQCWQEKNAGESILV